MPRVYGRPLAVVWLRLIKSQQQIRPQKLIECAKIAFTKLEVLIFGPIWFNVVAVRKFQHWNLSTQIKPVCEKPVKCGKTKEKRCVSNKVIYFLPRLCRLQPLKSAVSEEIFPEMPQTGAPCTPHFASLSPGNGFPQSKIHNPWLLTGSPCWKSNYHKREAWGALWTLLFRTPAAAPAATRLRIRNVLIMGTASQQQQQQNP